MKDKILKGRTKIIVTFAAIALMGSGVLLSAMPAAADEGGQHPHFMGKHFRKHLSDEQRAEIREHFENLTPEQRKAHREIARQYRSEVLSGFLGISPDVLRTRIENGENIRDIVKESGKTRADFRAYMMDYMQKHRLFENN